MSTAKLEARIEALEAEVKSLREELRAKAVYGRGWKAFVGAFPDDKLTREAQRLGRKYRESQRPKAVKGKKKPVHSGHRPAQSAAA
jgi:hypothetical protein